MSRVYRSKDYKRWHSQLSEKDQRIIDVRIDKYRLQNQLLHHKSLDLKLGLFEFKWISGLRVYFALLKDREGQLMLLLLGGNKNTQEDDIKKSKTILLKALYGIKSKK
jgi:putative addiction module killer protein